MPFFYRRARSPITFDDVLKELNNFHSSGTNHLKDLNDCFEGLKALITRFRLDSVEFECKNCRKAGVGVSKLGDDNRQNVEALRKENGELQKQYDDLKKKLEKENDVLQEKLDAATEDNKKLENEMKSIKREKSASLQNIDAITKELELFEKDVRKGSGEWGYGTDVDLSIDKRIAFLREQNIEWRYNMEKNVSCLEDVIEKLHTDMNDQSKQYEGKLSEKSTEYKNILQNRLEENDDLHKQVVELQEKYDRVASLEETCHDLGRNIEDANLKIADRERKFLAKEEEVKNMRQQLSIVQSEKENDLQKYYGLSRQLDSERSRNSSLSEQLSNQKATNKRFISEFDILTSENEELKKRIEELERKRKGHIQISIHSALKPTLSEQAVGELMSRMTERLGRDEVEIDHRLYNNSDDVKGPLVVLCINVSRLGTDVKEALKGVSKGIQDVAMLVLHHKETHALPSQSSDRILTGPEYKQLGIIIDLAFLSNRGLYQCEMNNKAIERFASFLLQYRKDS